MKKYIKYMWLVLLSVAVSSCEDYFKQPLTQDIAVEDIFADEVTAQTFLDGAYSILPSKHATQTTDGNTSRRIKICAMHAQNIGMLSEEGACGRATDGNWFMYHKGTLTPTEWDRDLSNQTNTTQKFEDIMMSRYIYIRKCLIYLQYVNTIPNASETFVKETSAQAKALMAFYYFEMMKRYGSVPFLTEVTDEDADLVTIGTRPALSDFVGWVDDLIVEAIADLPESYDSANLGRLTKAVAYAQRSRLWLWAASPLFNKRDAADFTECGHPGYAERPDLNYAASYDASLWTKAAQYSKEALDYFATQGITLVSTGDVKSDIEVATMNTPDNGNTECILFYRYTKTAAHVANFLSYSVPYGSICTANSTGIRGMSGNSISQNHVNMYRNSDGSVWSEELYDSDGKLVITDAQRQHYAVNTNPWEDLEPRFAANVIRDKQVIIGFLGESNPYTYQHNTGVIAAAVTWTLGYGQKRFLPDPVFAVSATTSYTWDLINVEMRLAEFHLNYAEALWNTGDISGAMEALKPTMRRGGLPVDSMTFPTTDATTAWNWINRERAVELLSEHFRYFDAKRWLKGEFNGCIKYGAIRRHYYDRQDGCDSETEYATQYGINTADYITMVNPNYDAEIAAKYDDPSDPDLTAAIRDTTEEILKDGYMIQEGYYYTQYVDNTFPKEQYLFPIIQSEMLRKCGWEQNPGY